MPSKRLSQLEIDFQRPKRWLFFAIGEPLTVGSIRSLTQPVERLRWREMDAEAYDRFLEESVEPELSPLLFIDEDQRQDLEYDYYQRRKDNFDF